MTTEKKNSFKETIKGAICLTIIVTAIYFGVGWNDDNESVQEDNEVQTVTLPSPSEYRASAQAKENLEITKSLGLTMPEFKTRWNKVAIERDVAEFTIEAVEVTEAIKAAGESEDSFEHTFTNEVTLSGKTDRSNGQLIKAAVFSSGRTDRNIADVLAAATLLFAAVPDKSGPVAVATINELASMQREGSPSKESLVTRYGYIYSYKPVNGLGIFFNISRGE